MARRWRRLRLWARQNRLGFWLAVLLGLAALAYAVVRFTDATRSYVGPEYEPKDMERQRYLGREGGPGDAQPGARGRPLGDGRKGTDR